MASIMFAICSPNGLDPSTRFKALQERGRRVFRSDDLTRGHRERLIANSFVQKVMRGWLISSSPSAREGDSTPW